MGLKVASKQDFEIHANFQGIPQNPRVNPSESLRILPNLTNPNESQRILVIPKDLCESQESWRILGFQRILGILAAPRNPSESQASRRIIGILESPRNSSESWASWRAGIRLRIYAKLPLLACASTCENPEQRRDEKRNPTYTHHHAQNTPMETSSLLALPVLSLRQVIHQELIIH